jgi:Xaa-Pro aminopeptidase
MAISPRETGVPLQAGNVLSNEPGFYQTGEYGIRIENLVVVKRQDELSTEDLEFLCFDTLTLCPVDTSLVATELLTGEEKEWLDEYHRQVYERLAPLLDIEHRNWLEKKTQALWK